MKSNVFYIRWLLCAAVWFFFSACQQLLEEDHSQSGTEASLKIQTRSAATDGISYPLYLYAFNEKGNCVASQTIVSSEEDIELSLIEGDYRIVAVAGLSDAYDVPEKPNIDEVITLEGTAGADTPLMIGKADVTVKSTRESTLDITLSYVVAAVNVSLSNLPSEVSAVEFILSPLHSTFSFEGEYGGASGKLETACQLDTENVWTAEPVYIFPGKGSETVFTIVLVMKNGTTNTYGYTYSGIPEAGRAFNIEGSYAGGITIGGNVVGGDWGAPVEVKFEFGSTGQLEGDDEEEGEGDMGGSLSEVPEVGSIWNGTIVAAVNEKDSETVELLLLSLEEWDITTSQVEELAGSYSVDDMTDWHLPTYDEAIVLRNTFSGDNRRELNDRISEYDDTLYGIDGEEHYLCVKEGAYYSFLFSGGTSITQAGTKRTYYTRLVKTLLCNINT